MDWGLLKRVLSMALLPPAGPMLLALAGLWLTRAGGRHRRLGRGLLLAGVLGAYALSTAVVAKALVAAVERGAGPPLTVQHLRAELAGPSPPGAIVILGGGMRHHEREVPDRETPNERTLLRLSQGAMLARESQLPILVSGGRPPRREAPESVVMARALETRFGLRARWTEEGSADTADNARDSAAVLRAAGVSRVVLVTQAYHMPRARAAFEAAGLEVLAAPHGFAGGLELDGPAALLPSPSAITLSWMACHEAVGYLWYRLRGHL